MNTTCPPCTAKVSNKHKMSSSGLASLPGDHIPVVVGEVLRQKQTEVQAAGDDGFWRGYFEAITFLRHHQGFRYASDAYDLTKAMALRFIHDKDSLKAFRTKAEKHLTESDYTSLMSSVYAHDKCQKILRALLDT